MFLIDHEDKAHYVESEDKSHKINWFMACQDPSNMELYYSGNKVFLARGVGRCKPAVFELVQADTLQECEEKIAQKYEQRLLENSLLCLTYYEVV